MFFSPLKNRRRSERQWVALPVHIITAKSSIEGTTLNLSEHGMYVFTAADIPMNSEIEVVFRPPEEEESVQVSAIVRRKVLYLYGIEFLNKPTQPAQDPRSLHSGDNPSLGHR